MLNHHKKPPNRVIVQGIRNRYGFTLIEMLVAVALVTLMMVMFASVFQIAGESIGRMRGLSENDQRSRSLQTIIKADLDKRTFRWVYPFAANENPGLACSNIGERQGYFYISENNPLNQLDDVLQFTVMTTLTMRNTDVTPYYGQALNLASLISFPNQPDADDAQLNPNNTGLSTVAEVALFVRNGNLYRRQLLIREPLSTAGTNPQPSDTNGLNPFDPLLTSPPLLFAYPGTGSFWNDFDYSAFYNPPHGAEFLGSNSIDNSSSGFLAIANPSNRFGFSPATVAGVVPGVSKEFIANSGTANIGEFIGRFTLEECSSANFRYPQNLSTNGGTPPTTYLPTDPAYGLTLTTAAPYTVSDFVGGPRRGEDLILANVHAFDIQVWDEFSQAFVNIGDPSLASVSSPPSSSAANAADYALGNRYAYSQGTLPSINYGPRITENVANNATNAVIDTWHPQINLNTTNDPAPSPNPSTGQTTNDDPPFRPLLFRSSKITLNASDVDSWVPNHSYVVGDMRFPSGPPGTILAAPYVPGAPAQLPYGTPFFYRCIQPGTSAAVTEPTWPLVNNQTVIDGGVVWQAVDNRKPLKAIKLEIRFLDTSSQQMRQLTIVHSLVD